jgi:hypothetical protein
LFFEQGIPFDIIELIEKLLADDKTDRDISFSGHDKLISAEVGGMLFAALSNFSREIQEKIILQEIDLDRVCFNTYRGTWSTNQIKTLIHNGIPLRWLFKEKPNATRMSLVYSHLINHLIAALLEEYAIRRLEDRQIGESLGNPITRNDNNIASYFSPNNLSIDNGESFVNISPNKYFSLVPVVNRTSHSILDNIRQDVDRCKKLPKDMLPIIVVAMDYIYLNENEQKDYREMLRKQEIQLIVVGLTFSQLLSEAEMNIAITSSQSDPDDVDNINVDKYPD